MSRREACWSGGTSKSNIRAAAATVQPWTISDVRTIMKATSKKTAASGNPASTGIIARKIGTAPRRPTHEMKASSSAVYRKGSKHSATVTGRATSMSTTAIKSEGPSIGTKALGVTSKPSMRKRTIWRAEPGREDVLLEIASAYEAPSRRRIPPPAFDPSKIERGVVSSGIRRS
jgi:hypothetical protein